MNRPADGWVSSKGVRCAVRRFQGLSSLQALRAEWTSILERQASGPHAIDSFFNGPEWGLAYAEAFVEPETIFGWRLSGETGGEALLAFRLEPSRGFGTLQRALFLADGTHDTDYLDIPRVGFDAETLVEATVSLLGREKELQAVVLAGLPDRSETLPALRAHLTNRGLPRREHEIQCCFAELPDSFDAYVKGLKPRVRSKIRQSLRNAEEARATFHWCDDPRTLQDHLTGLFHLHGIRWRAAGIPGCFVSEPRQRFYRNLSARLLGDGTLRFARLDVGGKPIAYQIGAVASRTYYQLQEGFDTGYSNLRVGTSLRAHMIRGLIEGGVRKYDFMADGSQHKSEWGSQGTRSFTVAFALPRVRARIAYSLRELLDRRRDRRPAFTAEPADVSRESE